MRLIIDQENINIFSWSFHFWFPRTKIWRFYHRKLRLSYLKSGYFSQTPPALQIKIFKKGKMDTYRIIPSFRKIKNFVNWIKTRWDILPKLNPPRFVYDSFMNDLSGRRQYFFLLISFLNSPYSNWTSCIFSTQSDNSFMEKYDLSLQKG